MEKIGLSVRTEKAVGLPYQQYGMALGPTLRFTWCHYFQK